MTAVGKLAMAEHALRTIIKARKGRSFKELDKAIDDAQLIYEDIMLWVRRPADVVRLKPTGTEG